MTFKGRSGYLYIACLQILICILVFAQFFRHPADSLFCIYGDGMKNYFTLQRFVQEPITSAGILKFNSFAYPYGDYVYYTDNTPFFAVPYRWFCQHVRDISAYVIPAFNFFIISNIIACSLLAYWVFRNCRIGNILSFLLALALPWSSAQLQRIWCGHYNLSLSVLPVAAIALFLLWCRHRHQLSGLLILSLTISGFSFCAFLLHGYYMAIITLFISALLFLHSVFTRKEPYAWLRISLSVLIPLVTIGLILLLLYATDLYLPLRKEHAMGYDFDEHKTIYGQLFTHYPYQRIFFPLYSQRTPGSVEMRSYLGNIGLFTLLVMFLGSLISKRFRSNLAGIQRDFFRDRVLRAIFFAGVLLLLISFGERYTIDKTPFSFGLPANFNAGFHKLEYLVYGLLTLFMLAQSGLWWRQRQNLKGKLSPGPRASVKEQILVLLCGFVIVYVMVAEYTFTYTNVLNPFWYLHFATRRVEQFRSIARFNWPFFWSFYVWIAYVLVRWYRQSGKAVRRLLVAAVLFAGVSEGFDNAIYLNKTAQKPNVFSAASLQQFGQLHINYDDYQAILPIPFFYVGSEDYTHTIDDEDDFSTYIMQMILYSKLPTMASKMSRTPPEFGVQMLDLIANDQMHPDLKRKLNTKPVLVVFDRHLITDTNAYYVPGPNVPLARELCMKTYTFIQRHKLQPIDSSGNKLFYSWQVM